MDIAASETTIEVPTSARDRVLASLAAHPAVENASAPIKLTQAGGPPWDHGYPRQWALSKISWEQAYGSVPIGSSATVAVHARIRVSLLVTDAQAVHHRACDEQFATGDSQLWTSATPSLAMTSRTLVGSCGGKLRPLLHDRFFDESRSSCCRSSLSSFRSKGTRARA